jgi:L-asparaginase II
MAALVEVTRGDTVESLHHGAVAVVQDERLCWSVGDVSTPVFARSAVKPIQALPLIETGAADRFGLSPAEIALACASHGGEPRHVALVEAWLARLGLEPTRLRCGAHWPMHEPSAFALARAGGAPGAQHNNCSGKHAGFLSAALHMGEDIDGYLSKDHPAQRRWMEALGELAGTDPADCPLGMDGCAIPTLAMPLSCLALAFARFADPAGVAPGRSRAMARVRAAMAGEPYLVAGEGRACTRIMQATGGSVLVKIGAEGVYVAMAPQRRLGLALKIRDGSMRAAEVAVVAALRAVLEPGDPIRAALEPLAQAPILNRNGDVVGAVRPA